MKKNLWLLLLAGALPAALAFAACGGDDDTGGDQTPAATTPAGTTAPAGVGDETPVATANPDGNNNTPPAAGGGTTVDVVTRNFAFDPAEISVLAGEPVTFNFTNDDGVPHTFTLYLDEGFTQPIDGGSATESEPEITVAFVAPGEYYFRCEIHPAQMQGELTAE